MTKPQNKLIYALKNGKSVHISDVERGLACNCVCPACGETLVAKKGNKNIHHFAHHSGQNCEYGYETSLHIAAKEILSKAKRFVIPPVFIEFPNSYKQKELYSEAKEIPIDDVKLEYRYNDIIPDIVLVSSGKELFVEIFVTHKIDDEKLRKIEKANISTIEIDLSNQDKDITEEDLSEILLNNTELKKWKYNAKSQYYLERFYAASDEREVVCHGLAMHVNDCPLKVRVWKGIPYANFIDSCLYCKYCISYQYGSGILCSGRKKISTLEDLKRWV